MTLNTFVRKGKTYFQITTGAFGPFDSPAALSKAITKVSNTIYAIKFRAPRRSRKVKP